MEEKRRGKRRGGEGIEKRKVKRDNAIIEIFV